MASDTALLIIDLQVALVAGAYLEGETLRRVAALLRQARATGTPIVFIQHDHAHYAPMKPGTDGWQFHPAVAPLAGELVINKRASDAFYGTPLRHELTARGIRHLIVTGMQSEFCVDATCRRALSEGFDVTLIADGHTTGDTDLLSAAQIIAHHNRTLGQLAHPDHTISVLPSAAIVW
jgi:nicotinamidase-related amidase